MVKVAGVPEQVTLLLVNDGVTATLPVMPAVVELVAVKEAILPVPLAAKLMPVLSFVHANTVPIVAPVNVIADVAAPLQ